MDLNHFKTPPPSLSRIVFLIYALHLFSAISGLISPVAILTAFTTGWPSIIAVIMSYIWKDDATGTFLDSHFDWLISTFWTALVFFAISWLLIATFVGMVIGLPMLIIVGLWVLYRLFKGVFALNAQKTIS